jgi:hypothetical protein
MPWQTTARRQLHMGVGALDKDFRALHTMRMTTYIKLGETTWWVGCHEPMPTAHLPIP